MVYEDQSRRVFGGDQGHGDAYKPPWQGDMVVYTPCAIFDEHPPQRAFDGRQGMEVCCYAKLGIAATDRGKNPVSSKT
jgi:hypothetical protein